MQQTFIITINQCECATDTTSCAIVNMHILNLSNNSNKTLKSKTLKTCTDCCH